LITLEFVSRRALVGGIVVAAALGCSTKSVVVDPSPSTTPNQPSTSTAFGGATNAAATPPLPISGGTLIAITRPDGSAVAVASDPDEDAVHVVSLADPPSLLGTLYLQPGDEPGRLVADAAGRVHVALRRGGAIATIMPTSSGASLLMRRDVCSAPRGLDYDPTTDSVWVACATGELMALPAGGGDATLSAQLDRDLRDVVVDQDAVYVTRFRSAEILTLNRAGALQNRTLPAIPVTTSGVALPDVAWRAVHAQPGAGLRMVYQIASTAPIDVAVPPGVSSYGDTTNNQFQGVGNGVVSVAVGSFGGTTSISAVGITSNPVVDLAVSPDGTFETISVDGALESMYAMTPDLVQLGAMIPSSANAPNSFVAIADARAATNPVVVAQWHGPKPGLVVVRAPAGAPLASASLEGIVSLPQKSSHVDTGFDVFHTATQAGIACMNCHPEGGDDGHVWTFQLDSGTRVRRTQALRGGVITASAPYHWDGDMPDLQALCDEVFTHRMGGDSLSAQQTPVLARFLNSLPRIPVSRSLDPVRVEKGQAIFEGSGACATCHTGGRGTLTANMDVGKTDSIGEHAPLQVPMLLGIADRAPYMHDGCAKTLLDRLNDTKCAGTAHGNTAQLSDDDKQNLVEYLESL
jgi:hypothetical protein